MEKITKYTDENRIKAVEVIKSCMSYSLEQIKDISVIEEDCRLLVLRKYFKKDRGDVTYYLVLNNKNGLSTIGCCGEEVLWNCYGWINTSLNDYECSYYNNNREKTIDLAIALIENWNEIKHMIEHFKKLTKREAYEVTSKLNNFTI